MAAHDSMNIYRRTIESVISVDLLLIPLLNLCIANSTRTELWTAPSLPSYVQTENRNIFQNASGKLNLCNDWVSLKSIPLTNFSLRINSILILISTMKLALRPIVQNQN